MGTGLGSLHFRRCFWQLQGGLRGHRQMWEEREEDCSRARGERWQHWAQAGERLVMFGSVCHVLRLR